MKKSENFIRVSWNYSIFDNFYKRVTVNPHYMWKFLSAILQLKKFFFTKKYIVKNGKVY